MADKSKTTDDAVDAGDNTTPVVEEVKNEPQPEPQTAPEEVVVVAETPKEEQPDEEVIAASPEPEPQPEPEPAVIVGAVQPQEVVTFQPQVVNANPNLDTGIRVLRKG